jgi:uncharacterized protein (DUF849 family)
MQDFSLLGVATAVEQVASASGMEDVFIKAGEYSTNVELVEHAVSLVRAMGCEAATPLEARTMLGIMR